MTGALEFVILGSGSSGGVPRADGNWGVCDPSDPRNRRSRRAEGGAMKRSAPIPSRVHPLRFLRRSSHSLGSLARDTRGASMVEYALVVSLVLVVAAPSVRAIGQRVNEGFQAVVATFAR